MSAPNMHIKEKDEDPKAMCGYVSRSVLPWWEGIESTKRGGAANCGLCLAAAKQKGLLSSR